MSRSDDADRLHLTIRVSPDQIERVKRRFAIGQAPVLSNHGAITER